MPKFDSSEWFDAGVGVLAVLVSTLIVWLLLTRVAHRARRHFQALLEMARDSVDAESDSDAAQRRLTVLRLVVNATRYALAVGAILLLLSQLHVKLDSLLLPAGFLGAALGMGAQNLVRDLVAGLFIVFEGQFAVGDVVSINGVLGTVEEVGLRVTRLRDDAAQIHFFPNGAITVISKYPRRYLSLLLLVPLEDGSQRAAAQVAVEKTLSDFEEDYDVLADGADSPEFGPSPDNLEGSRVLRCQLPVRPARLAVVREKLPGRVKVALEKQGLKTAAGADVEIINAPAV
jgi:small conductance mechanosensitive channel